MTENMSDWDDLMTENMSDWDDVETKYDAERKQHSGKEWNLFSRLLYGREKKEEVYVIHMLMPTQ